jgi:hypothetical protein
MNSFFGRSDFFPISLGFNCHVKVFIEQLGEKDRIPYLRQPFDWLGTPMWSICDMVASDFKDLANREYIVLRRRFVEKDTKYLTNTIYNAAFVHDYGKDISNVSDEKWKQVEEDYSRRIKRWNATLTCGKPILFLRLEEDAVERVDYPGSIREHPEYYYVESFAKLMKEKGVPFVILYLTTSTEMRWDRDLHICSIQFKKEPSVIVSAAAIERILNANKPFVWKALATL